MRIAFVAIFALASSAPGFAQTAGERLVRPPLTGFITGYNASQNGSSIHEQVPTGETVQLWTRMVTTQRFANLSRKTDAPTFLRNLGASVANACRGAKVSPISIDGGQAMLRADCPLNPGTGKPETFFAKAMMGATDLHVIQVAYRRIPSEADTRWAQAYLSGVTLCRSGDRQAACAAR